MSELIEDIQEDIKREDLITFWKKYGKIIVAFVLLFATAALSYTYWTFHQEQKKIEQAQAYEKLLLGIDPASPQDSLKELSDLARDGSPGYRLLAGLVAAGFSSDPALDLKNLSENPDIEKAFQEISLILSALADLDRSSPRAVLEMLAPFERSASSLRPLAREISGYAMLRLNNVDTALNLFQNLMHEQMATAAIRSRSQAMVSYIRGKIR